MHSQIPLWLKHNPALFILMAVFSAAVMVAFFIYERRKVVKVSHYVEKPIMTPNELEFFGRLRSALPDFEIFPQVAMSAVIKTLRVDEANNVAARNRIDRKVIDFVIYTKAYQLVCLVELDDKTHNSMRDVDRDALTASAKIKTLRFKSTSKPTAEVLRKAIQDLTKPTGEETKLHAG